MRLLTPLILLATATAFLQQQPPVAQMQRMNVEQTKAHQTDVVFDASLENFDIVDDNTITAARKCGFCIG